MVFGKIKRVNGCEKNESIKDFSGITDTAFGLEVSNVITGKISLKSEGNLLDGASVKRVFNVDNILYVFASDGYVYKVDKTVKKISEKKYFSPRVAKVYSDGEKLAVIENGKAEIVGTGAVINVLGTGHTVWKNYTFSFSGNRVYFDKGNFWETGEIDYFDIPKVYKKVIKLAVLDNMLFIFADCGILKIENFSEEDYEIKDVYSTHLPSDANCISRVGGRIVYGSGNNVFSLSKTTVKKELSLAENQTVSGEISERNGSLLIPVKDGDKNYIVSGTENKLYNVCEGKYYVADKTVIKENGNIYSISENQRKTWVSKRIFKDRDYALIRITINCVGVDTLTISCQGKTATVNLIDGLNVKDFSMVGNGMIITLSGGGNFKVEEVKITYRI